MLKVIGNDSWEGILWGEDQPRTSIIKMSSRGLDGIDKQAFVKRACGSSDELLEKVAKLDVKPGETLIHLIALGSTEGYGPNRNGDGFSKAACQKYHDTFVKKGHFFRDHKNTDPKKSYGVIKASAYNDTMSRVELIVGLNSTEKVAKENGGLVADKELMKLEKGDDIPVSMACFLEPDTPVLVQEVSGYIAIKDIKVGQHVWTKDSQWKPVTYLNRRIYTGNCCKIDFMDDDMPSLHVTADHLFWAITPYEQPRWVSAEQLAEGCCLVGYSKVIDGQPAYIDKTFRRIKDVTVSYKENIQTYNIEVQDDPSYLVANIISHNCTVPFDICSFCGNKAESPAKYCKSESEGGRCKAGGLHRNMGKLASVDGVLHHLHADNTQPSFFDISHVFVPADRIAYSSGVLVKGASCKVLNGVELAEAYQVKQGAFVSVPEYLSRAVTAFHTGRLWQKKSAFYAVMDTQPLKDVAVARRYKLADACKAFNDLGVCLSASQYLQLATGLPFEKVALAAEIIAPLSNERFVDTMLPVMELPSQAPEKLAYWCRCQGLSSVHPNNFLKQAGQNAVRMEKNASFVWTREQIYEHDTNPNIRALSQDFAAYKLAFLQSLPADWQENTADLLVGRDYLSF